MTLRLEGTQRISSPDWVRLSFGADMVLGFSPGVFLGGALNTTINLLQYYPDGCKANCSYCGQAREVSQGPDCKTLIRVEWPLRRLDDVLRRIKERQGDPRLGLQGICVGELAHPRAAQDAVEITRRIREEGIELRISELVTPTYTFKKHLVDMRKYGADMIDVAIDGASKRVFEETRGKMVRSMHRWERYLEGIDEAVEVFGRGNAGIHLIVGLGETEREAVDLMWYAHERGAKITLFAFYPEQNTVMERRRPAPVNVYRRVQLARWLIENDLITPEDILYDQEGRIVDMKIPEDLTLEELAPAFMTSGCPGCNRPYSNERPGMEMRNYPWYPNREQALKSIRQTRLPSLINKFSQ